MSRYKVNYLLSYKQVQIELANHVLQFFADMEMHIDLLVEQHADANSASPEINVAEKNQRATLGNAAKWRQSHKFVLRNYHTPIQYFLSPRCLFWCARSVLTCMPLHCIQACDGEAGAAS